MIGHSSSQNHLAHIASLQLSGKPLATQYLSHGILKTSITLQIRELSMNTAILELTLPEAGLLSNLLYVSMQATGKAFNEHPLPVQQLSHKIATVYLALEKAEPTSVLDILKGVSDATEQPSLPDNT